MAGQNDTEYIIYASELIGDKAVFQTYLGRTYPSNIVLLVDVFVYNNVWLLDKCAILVQEATARQNSLPRKARSESLSQHLRTGISGQY